MKALIILLTACFMLFPALALAEDHEEKGIHVQAWDFSDSFLVVEKGDPCAGFLSYLMSPDEKYEMLGITNVMGPPGVVYTLENHKGHIAILKCGTAGCGGHDGETGHDEGGH